MTTATFPTFTAGRSQARTTAESPVPKLNHQAIYVSSILWMSVLFVLAAGVPISIYLDDWIGGMGLGAFTAVWGGPGFGVMAASARVSMWQEKYGEDH